MEIVQDYCDYIQITQGEIDALYIELDEIICTVSTEDEARFSLLLELLSLCDE